MEDLHNFMCQSLMNHLDRVMKNIYTSNKKMDVINILNLKDVLTLLNENS